MRHWRCSDQGQVREAAGKIWREAIAACNFAQLGALTYLTKDSVAIVGQNNAAHRVEQHLEHGLGSKGGAHDIAYRLGGNDVGLLGSLALLTLRVCVEN